MRRFGRPLSPKRQTLPPSSTPPWWRPDRHAARRPHLVARARIASAVRRWFEAQDFLEVQTAGLQVSPGAEAHLHAFATQALDATGEARALYLHTSPEFACKKLLAAGEERIVSFGPVWRNRERGALHHPEFTMLEWYRTRAPYEAMMQDCAELLALAAETAKTRTLRFRGRSIDPFLPPERISLAEAFKRFAGIDLLATLDSQGEPDLEALAAAARQVGVRVAADDSWSDIFSRLLVGMIEPGLAKLDRAVLLYEYPAPQAALARTKPGDPRVCERFELYGCGVELANAYCELTDPAEQRRRFESEMAEKARVYGERFPLDEDFLAALALMPPASGCALGFDRLVMLATGAERIEDVVWTPVASGGEA
ncbi:MAG: Lysine--tRNA ligase [Caulobacteraceae bacterium]|nr:Lysine--tRNA ligase [Caulobacteraceae bacterium]